MKSNTLLLLGVPLMAACLCHAGERPIPELTFSDGANLTRLLAFGYSAYLAEIGQVGPAKIEPDPRGSDYGIQTQTIHLKKTKLLLGQDQAPGAVELYRAPKMSRTPYGPWNAWERLSPTVGELFLLVYKPGNSADLQVAGSSQLYNTGLALPVKASEIEQVQLVLSHYAVPEPTQWEESSLKPLLSGGGVSSFKIGCLVGAAARLKDPIVFNKAVSILLGLFADLKEDGAKGQLLSNLIRSLESLNGENRAKIEGLTLQLLMSNSAETEQLGLLALFDLSIRRGNNVFLSKLSDEQRSAIAQKVRASKDWRTLDPNLQSQVDKFLLALEQK